VIDLVKARLDVGVEHPRLPRLTVVLIVSSAWWADSRGRNP